MSTAGIPRHDGPRVKWNAIKAAVNDAEWTKQHSHSDAIRIAMKRFLADLWEVWNGKIAGHATADAHRTSAGDDVADHSLTDIQVRHVGHVPISSENRHARVRA